MTSPFLYPYLHTCQHTLENPAILQEHLETEYYVATVNAATIGAALFPCQEFAGYIFACRIQ